MWNEESNDDNVIDEKLKIIKRAMVNIKIHLGKLFPANIVEKREHITRIIDGLLDELVPEVSENEVHILDEEELESK